MCALQPVRYAGLLTEILNIKNIEIFIENLDELIESLCKLTHNAVAYVNSCIEKINSLDLDESELKQKLKDCKKKLKEAKVNAQNFRDKVETFFEYADLDEEREESMKKAIKEKDFKTLNDYIFLMRSYLEQSKKYYEEDFLPVFKEAEELCKSTPQQCEVKKTEAKNRKNVARVVGGAIAAGGVAAIIGAGVTASVVVGAFTFGIGTPLVLGLTAVGATGVAAIGTGTAGVAGVTTHLLASHFEKLQKTFQDISNNFDSLADDFSDLGLHMDKVIKRLKAVSEDSENIATSIGIQCNTHEISKVFDILLKGIKTAHQKLLSPMTSELVQPIQAPASIIL